MPRLAVRECPGAPLRQGDSTGLQDLDYVPCKDCDELHVEQVNRSERFAEEGFSCAQFFENKGL
jgi:hypothetical protein